ncbi:protein LORF2II [Spheniscid alphaherpesvirus 1]|uniref:Protein LORF2II n=1 Tax=Spheniscid alphaherpesvirus 1 TaxID=2560777 RepID=A0A1R3T5I5_9ALPH|nr:protein LORF2II [Spheniscid alphaherpesvirus 1]SCO83613.1 protein LORF2II [Spheniscid alphaherpesvirus 1]
MAEANNNGTEDDEFPGIPPLPPGVEEDPGRPETIACFRTAFVNQQLCRLFTRTLNIVRRLWYDVGRDGGDNDRRRVGFGYKHFKNALQAVQLHEPLHIGGVQQNGTYVNVTVVDGLVCACRGLALEVIWKRGCTADLLMRLCTTWSTAMKIIRSTPASRRCNSLRNSYWSTRGSIINTLLLTTPGYETWSFWKIMDACLEWCCMFHTLGDKCPFGSPRIGPIWEDVSKDKLLCDMFVAIQAWSHGPYLKAPLRVDDSESSSTTNTSNESGPSTVNSVISRPFSRRSWTIGCRVPPSYIDDPSVDATGDRPVQLAPDRPPSQSELNSDDESVGNDDIPPVLTREVNIHSLQDDGGSSRDDNREAPDLIRERVSNRNARTRSHPYRR